MTPLFSTAYLPPISYVEAMSHFGSVTIEANETFPKQTYRNRAVIMTASGPRPLIVPTLRNNHSRTEEVRIDYRDRWQVVHFRTLTAAYAASPYWQYYADELENLLSAHYEFLVDLNSHLTQWLLKKLGISTQLSYSMDFVKPGEQPDDFRLAFSPKRQPRSMKPYYQVFSAVQPFAPDLTSLDLLMNLGPEATSYIQHL